MRSFTSDAPTLEGSERLRMRFATRQTFRNAESKYVKWIADIYANSDASEYK